MYILEQKLEAEEAEKNKKEEMIKTIELYKKLLDCRNNFIIIQDHSHDSADDLVNIAKVEDSLKMLRDFFFVIFSPVNILDI